MHPLAAPGALWVLSRAGKVPRPPAGGRNLPQEIDCVWMARKRYFLAFSVSQGVSPLRRRPKGFPVALWKPSAPLPRMGISTRNEMLPCFFRFTGGSPLRRRPKGFPIALWKPSASLPRMEICTKMDCAKSSINNKKRARQVETPAWHAFILLFLLSHPAPVAQLPPCLPPRWWHDAVPAIPAAAAPAAAPAHR